VTNSGLTASQAVFTDANKVLTSTGTSAAFLRLAGAMRAHWSSLFRQRKYADQFYMVTPTFSGNAVGPVGDKWRNANTSCRTYLLADVEFQPA